MRPGENKVNQQYGTALSHGGETPTVSAELIVPCIHKSFAAMTRISRTRPHRDCTFAISRWITLAHRSSASP